MSTYALSLSAETSGTICVSLQYRRRDPSISQEFLRPTTVPTTWMVGVLSLNVSVMFLHLSFLIQTHSNLVAHMYLGAQMDQNPVALASRINACRDSFSPPLPSENREYFGGLS